MESFFSFISLEFQALVPNFRAGRHLPCLWGKKRRKKRGREAISPERAMNDEALRQGHAEHSSSKTKGRGRARPLRVTTKKLRLRTCETRGTCWGNLQRRSVPRNVCPAGFLPMESGSVNLPAEAWA